MRLSMLIVPSNSRSDGHTPLYRKRNVLESMIDEGLLDNLTQTATYVWNAELTTLGLTRLAFIERKLRSTKIAYKKELD